MGIPIGKDARYATLKSKFFSIFQLVEYTIMRQIQLEMIFYSAKNILGAEVDSGLSRKIGKERWEMKNTCLLYTSPSPRDAQLSRMPSSA